jgi:UDP-galactopyranose mutase
MSFSEVDCVVIGAGFCGSVIARKLAEAGKKVLIFERRNHIAGNMYDENDSAGILIQKYGPHIFHTHDKNVYDFITKYSEWSDYHHAPAVELNGIVTPSPSNYKTIDVLYNAEDASNLKAHLEKRYPKQKSVTILELYDCEDNLIKQFAEKLFELNYRPYTVKQWGTPPEKVDPATLKRVPVRLDYSEGYFDDAFQCMPQNGYTHFFQNLLNHENIEVKLNADALKMFSFDIANKQVLMEGKPISVPIVYTGAVDELMKYQYGELPYRSLKFELKTLEQDSFQPASVVAYPFAEGYTRITEFKKLPPQNIPGKTTIAYEYSLSADRKQNQEPYYPIITDDNVQLHTKYVSDISKIPNLFLCGRLADYKYYNMDMAILRAFDVFEEVERTI